MSEWKTHWLSSDLTRKAINRSTLLHNLYVRVRFPIEGQLLNGAHRSSNSHPSIIHFSVSRSATQSTKGILSRCAKENGMTPAHLNGYAEAKGMPFFDRLSANQMETYKQVFKPKGYIYSVFGGFVRGIPELERYLIILMIRDPRDSLTSLYYSNAFTHSLPIGRTNEPAFLANRNRVRKMSVDDFVLSEKDQYCEKYRVYMKELENSPNVLVTKYEDMISDFANWLDTILSFCSLSCSETTRNKLIAEARRSQNTKENKMRHKRQVTPGDHRRKLIPETIAKLNADLADILSAYGYV